MANTTTTSVLIGGVKTTDKWVDQFYFVLWADAGMTQPLNSATSGTRLQGDGAAKVQTDPIIFDGLVWGRTYWVSVQTITSESGAASPLYSYAFVAGNSTPPVVVYTYSQVGTPSGYSYTIVPTVYPTDIDHYEYWYTYDTASSPASTTVPSGQSTTDSFGRFYVFTGGGSGTVTLWVRAVNTSGIKQVWTNLAGGTVDNQTKVRVRSTGQYAAASGYGPTQIWLNNELAISGTGLAKGFNVIVMRASGPPYIPIDYQIFNTADDPSRAQAMANFINAYQDGSIIIVLASVETAGNHANNANLNAAMYRIGASRQVWEGAYRVCSAYILIGQWNIGQGNGIELYAGSADLDPNASVETTFYINNGKPIGFNGTYTPAFQIDASRNDMSPFGSVPPSLTRAFTYDSGSNFIRLMWNALAIFRTDQAQTVYTYPNGQMANTSLSATTKYWFFPFGDENPADVSIGWYKNVIFVNDVPGGVGSPNNAYLSFDYACVQSCYRMDRVPLSNGGIAASTTAPGNTGGGSLGGSGVCLREDVLVTEKTKGLIPIGQIVKADWVDSPDGWVEVGEVYSSMCENWIGIRFAGHEDEGEYVSTLTHGWEDINGDMKVSSELSVGDLIPTKRGVTHPCGIRFFTEVARKVMISVKSPKQLYYIGPVGIQTHNAPMTLVCD